MGSGSSKSNQLSAYLNDISVQVNRAFILWFLRYLKMDQGQQKLNISCICHFKLDDHPSTGLRNIKLLGKGIIRESLFARGNRVKVTKTQLAFGTVPKLGIASSDRNQSNH